MGENRIIIAKGKHCSEYATGLLLPLWIAHGYHKEQPSYDWETRSIPTTRGRNEGPLEFEQHLYNILGSLIHDMHSLSHFFDRHYFRNKEGGVKNAFRNRFCRNLEIFFDIHV
jgi:hypothetical protein